MSQDESPMELAARRVVELGNEVADLDQEADLWDIADGLLAGAVHYWLYAHQPCNDLCVRMRTISSAELRLAELRKLLDELPERATTSTLPMIQMQGGPDTDSVNPS